MAGPASAFSTNYALLIIKCIALFAGGPAALVRLVALGLPVAAHAWPFHGASDHGLVGGACCSLLYWQLSRVSLLCFRRLSGLNKHIKHNT